jgi:hypothetical protein
VLFYARLSNTKIRIASAVTFEVWPRNFVKNDTRQRHRRATSFFLVCGSLTFLDDSYDFKFHHLSRDSLEFVIYVQGLG